MLHAHVHVHVHAHVVVDSFGTGRLLGFQRGCCWAIGGVRAAREGRKGLRATVCVRAHRHGRVELAVDLGLDSFHLSLVQPLGFRVGGRHLVHWRHLH